MLDFFSTVSSTMGVWNSTWTDLVSWDASSSGTCISTSKASLGVFFGDSLELAIPKFGWDFSFT
jgi:hypothetical protein